MRVKQIANNQFKIVTDEGEYFQSYESVIAFKDNNSLVSLGVDYRYSRTTMKYLVEFLGLDSIKEVDRYIKNGAYVIDENLHIGDKQKFIKKVKKIAYKKDEFSNVSLKDCFDELQSLCDGL